MKNILIAVVLGFVWALWPILAQKYARGHHVYTFITLGTMITVLIGNLASKQSTGSSAMEISFVAMILIPLAMGLLNGLGMFLYPVLLGNVPKPSVWVSIVTALVCVGGTVIGSIMSRSISFQEVAGTCIIIIGIAVMMYKPS